MEAWGYIRVSSAEQVDGYGLAAQEAAIKAYCSTNGIDLSGVYSEKGVSGAAGDADELKRPEFLKMLANPAVKVVIVKNTSRLWRDDNARYLVSRALRKGGIKVISIDQPTFSLDAGTPVDKFMGTMFAAIDELDKNLTVARMWGGIQAKVESGERGAGQCPFGYKWVLDGKKKVVAIDPEAAAMVKAIFNKYLAYGSVNAVATWLNEHGYKTQRGKEWTAPSVKVILTNRFYIGELWYKGVKYSANHEPIISKVIFGKVQAALQRKKRMILAV